MVIKIQRVTQDSSWLGEGPHWDGKTLYYVDMAGKKLLKHDPANNKTTSVSVGNMIFGINLIVIIKCHVRNLKNKLPRSLCLQKFLQKHGHPFLR